ncbi:Golgi complex component 7-domain-containing protein [Rhodofomes roseus]|uniref:Conserved oligomeric Golgi complex subunit 7 n=1 Tax=Rhodofomes roseus TaxID=34475 RepID=A0ABQ8K1L7_9APHY|nr:Golgi complex component 7-domain-containing protein [Rhodofomes roseus]KAH9830159.1 Golgi complex component 7-domain-containing protein [Rhodofomes roseus]
MSSTDLLASLESQEDVVAWINSALEPDEALVDESPMELTELDRRVSSLVGALEIASEDTSATVERLIDDISRSATRLTYDLHFMRDGALSLQSILQNVETKSKASVAAETNVALERLHFLDTVKRNMEAAREVLREAESWGTLESDVTSLLGEKNYEKAAERLSEASKSMAVFENTPEYESRRTLMISLQNQLEASLSSALVAAVSSQDVAVCRNYFGIFSNIQREAEFRNYYYGSRRASLLEMWQSATLRDCEGSPDVGLAAQTFAAFLPTFYASFSTILQTERTSIPAIFPDPQQTLSTLISSTLSALQPTFSQHLADVTSFHGPNALRELIAAYRATEEFALTIEKILEKLGFSSLVTSAANTTTDGPRDHARRRSISRMSLSMSRRMPPHRSSESSATFPTLPVLDWDTDLFGPFIDFQADYASLERRLLDDGLASALQSTPRPTSGADYARVLRERAVDVFGAAEEAVTRCNAFTHGYGAAGLVRSVDHLVSAFAYASRSEIASRKSATTNSAGAETPGSETDLADLDYTAEDWAEIQALLHLLEAVRALLDRMVSFEGKLRGSLIQMSMYLRAARQDIGVFGSHDTGTTRGALHVLMQSTLNSAELHAIFESVDPEPSVPTQPAPSVPPSPDSRRMSFMGSGPLSPLMGLSAPSQPILTEARSAISAFAHACQVALQDTILGPLYAHLSAYPTLSLWATPDPSSKAAGATGATSAVHVPTFSLSPSTTMSRVAEGLLSLPRLFEVYADDDALAVSLHTLPFLSQRFLRALAESVQSPPAGPPELRSRRTASMALLPGQQIQAPPQPQDIQDMHFSPEGVTAAWLASLTRTLLARLTRDVLPQIPRLTLAGAAQLSADLGWLANIVEALNADWAPLRRWRKWIDVTDADGKKKIVEGATSWDGSADGEKDDDGDGEDNEDDLTEEGDSEAQVVRTVTKLRGWTT